LQNHKVATKNSTKPDFTKIYTKKTSFEITLDFLPLFRILLLATATLQSFYEALAQ
jgi:hypothetical protein